MKLDEIRTREDVLLYMERYVDEGTKRYSPFASRSEVELQYQPSRGAPSFELVTVQVPAERVSIVEADLPASLRDRYVRPDGVIFIVHPETWASADVDHLDELHALPRGEPIRVAPTASTRTVLVLAAPAGVPRHFIKLHLPRRISRFNRRLRLKNIENSVRVTADLAQVRLDGFAYLPDALGCTFGREPTSWGFLLRDGTPRPVVSGRALVPCFALYGGDLAHPGDLPLMVQLIERLGVDPEAFVVDEIMVPIVVSWATIARERGFLLESHAQNTLLELDEAFRPRRIVHRDFDVWIDAGARRRAGLDVPFRGALIGTDSQHPAAPHYSLVYDRFIGCEFFDFLLECITRFYRVDEEAIRARVRKAFHEAFPEADRVFPRQTTFYFSNAPQPGNGFTLVDTREAPRWR